MADQMTGLLSPMLRRRRLAAIKDHLSGDVLDYGCGTGHLAPLVSSQRYLGVDRDPESISTARAHFPQHRFEVIDPKADWISPLGDRRFDRVVLLAVLEHLDDPKGFFERTLSLLAPRGRFLITTPNPSFEWMLRLGGSLGICSKEALEEHQPLIDGAAIVRISESVGLCVLHSGHFLLGANQLFILARPAEAAD